LRLIWAYPRYVLGAPSGCIAKEEMLWFWKCYGMGGPALKKGESLAFPFLGFAHMVRKLFGHSFLERCRALTHNSKKKKAFASTAA
jgi:hypothetical protein